MKIYKPAKAKFEHFSLRSF